MRILFSVDQNVARVKPSLDCKVFGKFVWGLGDSDAQVLQAPQLLSSLYGSPFS